MDKQKAIIYGSLVVVILLGLIHLNDPFTGDQAFFILFGQMMDEGFIPYKDIWDVKQPGIYLFYYAAGKVAGFSEWGVHFFELIYWALFAVYGVWILKKLEVFKNPKVAWFFPLLTVGVYYAIMNPHKFTQVEGLVGFPLFVSMTLPFYALEKGKNVFLIQLPAGLFFSVVLFYKLAFLPVLGLYAIYLTHSALPSFQFSWKKVLQYVWLPIILGNVILPTWFMLYVLSNDILSLVQNTYFEIPFTIIQEVNQKDFSVFLKATLKAMVIFGPLGLMAFAGLLHLNKKNKELIGSMILWCLTGMWVVYMQKFSYWDYQFLLFLVPLGTLATIGLDFFLDRYNQGRWRYFFFVAVLTMAAAYGWFAGKKIPPLVKYKMAIGNENQIEFHNYHNPAYSRIQQEVAFLKSPESIPGPIYVGGNPLYYHLSGRFQGAAIIGWSFELLTTELWSELADQLDEGNVPYIFLEIGYTDPRFLEERPALSDLLRNKYRLMRSSEEGNWYTLKAN